MKKVAVAALLLSIVVVNVLCRKAPEFKADEYDPRLSGGAATTFIASSQAFGQMVDGLETYDAFMHELGDKMFEQTFVSAPSPHYPGLGPIFNNVSCVSCHHNDGKGTPTLGLITSSLLARISIPGTDEYGGPKPAPGFGGQLQDKAITGSQPEVKVNVSYQEIPFTFPDGQQISLRKPTYTLTNPYIPLPAGYMISVRLAPPVFGLGLLNLIPQSTIEAAADPTDKNRDGITGHPNYVYDPQTGKTELGRFGLKANVPTLLAQVAGALQQDMGVTNYVYSRESSYGQSQYDDSHDDPDVPDSIVNALTFYVQTLAAPARRNVTDPDVQHGEKLFTQINCSGCHTPTVYTDVDVRLPMLSHQRIHPYTDMLLHDMGSDLGDGRPDYKAGGSEWRTSPLWGVGLFPKTNGEAFYLHDGRARTLIEAILWHGGEAERAKDAFVHLSRSDRDDLVKFLKSL
ncbi:MAG TPA: di-heme oxidoredictase family protein [Edaphocola sp.]|nr:di-heme oxidoredictase family protein [Edaphocola sp.]